MKWIQQYAASLMFVLFCLLASAMAAAAIPKLLVPLIAAFVAVLLLALITRLKK
jgi:hypothetical protein